MITAEASMKNEMIFKISFLEFNPTSMNMSDKKNHTWF